MRENARGEAKENAVKAHHLEANCENAMALLPLNRQPRETSIPQCCVMSSVTERARCASSRRRRVPSTQRGIPLLPLGLAS